MNELGRVRVSLVIGIRPKSHLNLNLNLNMKPNLNINPATGPDPSSEF